jgi:hypothetical protein
VNRNDDAFAQRFWSKVDKSGDCWLWISSRNPGGYGTFTVGSRTDGSRTTASAHRVAYELAVGPIPDGLTIDHLCRNRACVNPAHLEAVSGAVNTKRGMSGAYALSKTHCPHGHAYNAENTYFVAPRTEGGRQGRHCRACVREAMRDYRDRMRKTA